MIVVLLVALAVAVAVAAASRGDRKPAGTPTPKPNVSKQFGDNADLMRRLQRKHLVTTTR